MPGIAGRRAQIMVPGAAVVFTNEATTDQGDHKTYVLTTVAKRTWDPFIAITVNVGGSPAAEAYSINRLTGTVLFAAVNAGRAAVTVSGSYLPLSVAAGAYDYGFTVTSPNAPNNAFGDVWVTRLTTVKDLSATLSRWWTDTYFRDALVNASTVVLAFFPDSSATVADVLAWVLMKDDQYSAARDGVQSESLQFDGTPDADNRVVSLTP